MYATYSNIYLHIHGFFKEHIVKHVIPYKKAELEQFSLCQNNPESGPVTGQFYKIAKK